MNSGIRRSMVAVATVLSASLGVHDVQGQEKPAATAQPLVGGCPAENLAFHRCALEKAKTFVPPRTPSGKPDLQGYWRPRLVQQYSVEGVSGTERSVGDANPWPIVPAEIVEPADRKIPYQPWAARVGRIGENVEKYIDPRGACGPGGVPRIAGATVSGPVHDPNQILQPPGDDQIVWLFEDVVRAQVSASFVGGRCPQMLATPIRGSTGVGRRQCCGLERGDPTIADFP